MIKYIFTNNELKTMFCLAGFPDFNNGFFSSDELTEEEMKGSIDSLIQKGILKKIGEKELYYDALFKMLIKTAATSKYFFSKDNYWISASDIIVSFESENEKIVKLGIWKNIEMFQEIFNVSDGDLFIIGTGTIIEGEAIESEFGEIKELII